MNWDISLLSINIINALLLHLEINHIFHINLTNGVHEMVLIFSLFPGWVRIICLKKSHRLFRLRNMKSSHLEITLGVLWVILSSVYPWKPSLFNSGRSWCSWGLASWYWCLRTQTAKGLPVWFSLTLISYAGNRLRSDQNRPLCGAWRRPHATISTHKNVCCCIAGADITLLVPLPHRVVGWVGAHEHVCACVT